MIKLSTIFLFTFLVFNSSLLAQLKKDDEKKLNSKKEFAIFWEDKKGSSTKGEKSSKEILTELHIGLINKILKVNPLSKTELKEIEIITKSCITNDLKEALHLSYYTTAKIYHALKQPNIALQYLKLAQIGKTELNVKNTPVLYAKLYSETGEYKKSNEVLKNLFRKKSYTFNFDQEFLFINNLISLKNYKTAIDKLKNLKTNNLTKKNQVDVLNKLALCYIYTDKVDDGIETYQEAIKLTKGNNSNQKEKVKESFSKALKLNQRFKEDVTLISESINEDKSNKNPLEYLRLAESHFALKDYSQAAISIENFIVAPNYSIIDKSEIEVIRNTARNLKNDVQARKFFNFYTMLEDTITRRIQELKFNNNNKGLENLLQLETLRKEKEISQNAIQSLIKEDALKEDFITASRWAIGLLLGLIVIGFGAGIYILRVSKQRRIANQKLALRSLRSQMNPHFIFNALNSVNSFISENDQRSANKFLTNFSRLMRSVMENSEYDFIPLQKELEILELYLTLEHFRFKDQFEYAIEVNEEVDEEDYNIPPMLVQPYIENAIWHGLRYKTDSGILKLGITTENENLIVTISDNGIGRQKSAELKTANQKKNKSTALRNIKQRIEIVNELNEMKINVSIKDLKEDGTGTVVKLVIPQQKIKG